MCGTQKISSKIHCIPEKNQPTAPSASLYLVYKCFRISQDFLEMKMFYVNFKELATSRPVSSHATLFTWKKPSSDKVTECGWL